MPVGGFLNPAVAGAADDDEVGWLVDLRVGGSSHAPRTSVVDVGGVLASQAAQRSHSPSDRVRTVRRLPAGMADI